MTIMSDKWITAQCQGDSPMLTPFHAHSISALPCGRKVTSLGISSFGYDLSLGSKFKVMRQRQPFQASDIVIDPCNFDPSIFTDIEIEEGGTFALPPRGFALGVSVERIIMPADVFGICMEKSTCARSAFEVTVTPIEPEWEGYLTLELFNKTDYTVKLTPGMGICQLLFFKGDQRPEVSYKDRNGKYQDQPNSPVAAAAKHN